MNFICKTGGVSLRLLQSSPYLQRLQEFHSSIISFKGNGSTEQDITYPIFKERTAEKLVDLKNRLVYQSRKRGTLEIGILLSAFVSQHLQGMTIEQLGEYDKLINKSSNEWDLYYWITGSKNVPDEFNNSVMTLLKRFAKNEKKELRAMQPPLFPE